LHAPAQGEQFAPSANAPGGQVVPEEVTLGAATQRVASLASGVKPARHAVQVPVVGAQDAQPIWQTDKQRQQS
jgi:hypothetical protein